MSAPDSVKVDEAAVRRFIHILHEQAAATAGQLVKRGSLQLCRWQPDGKVLTTRYEIGDAERMAADAIMYSEGGYNVSCEGRTVDPSAPRRGIKQDTVAVFALVCDSDQDNGKNGRLSNGHVAVVVDTSVGTGNVHQWVFLDHATSVEAAVILGARMRKAAGADSGSFDPTHCYRVAGTVNYLSEKKVARGRTIAMTRISETPGNKVSFEALNMAYPDGRPSPSSPKSSSSKAPSGHAAKKSSLRVKAKAQRRATANMDRSRQFQATVATAVKSGMSIDELEVELRNNPQGCAEKYLEPTDRLRDELERSWAKAEELVAEQKEPAPPPPPPCTLADVHAAFRKWLGNEYDLDTIDAVAAAGASERLAGDPLWLLIVSGPGNAKTETVQALAGCGGHVTSTIASEGALLSAAPKRGKGATGGLLRKIGERGLLVIKDVTSILAANRDTRGTVLAALREIYDGRWERNVGIDGGQTLTWEGRLVVIGAVTTAWDTAHGVVAAMGDRFVLIRANSGAGRREAGMRAVSNTGSEVAMRQELAAAVGGLVAHVDPDKATEGSQDEAKRVLAAADIVTYARTGIERSYNGDVIDAHAPEMPTRLAKQLTQLIRGAVAIGMTREAAMRLAIRCAGDSIPPLRLEILLDLAAHPRSRPIDVRRRLSRPWSTIKREMEALHMLTLLQCDEEIAGAEDKPVWRYRLASSFDTETLLTMAASSHHQKCQEGQCVRRRPIGLRD
jgi:hypothetical protein